MRHLKKFEDINIPIKVGDTVLGGRFKNKKMVVKKIGKNKKGDVTINDKPLLKFRLLKESLSDDITEYLSHLEDDGFVVELSDDTFPYIRVFKPKYGDFYAATNLQEFSFSEIGGDISRFVDHVGDEFTGDEFTELDYTISTIYYAVSQTASGILKIPNQGYFSLERKDISIKEILNPSLDFKLLNLTIVFRKTF